MNENDLREAMRATMTLTAPPPMESVAAVRAGRRSVRNRAVLAGAGVTAVLAAGALAVPAGLHLASTDGTPMAAAPVVHPTPDPSGTKPVWPLDGDGQPQDDATADSGTRYNQGKKLLDELKDVVPGGWATPTGNTDDDIPLQSHQATAAGDPPGTWWSYMADVAVEKAGRTGHLVAEVETTNTYYPSDPCKLTLMFWSVQGTCEVLTVNGTKIGVATANSDTYRISRIDQWAAYKHPDGTVVFVAQSKYAANSTRTGREPLTTLPFTKQQLATTTLNDKFHLN